MVQRGQGITFVNAERTKRAALVTSVHGETVVSLIYVDDEGTTVSATSVRHRGSEGVGEQRNAKEPDQTGPGESFVSFWF